MKNEGGQIHEIATKFNWEQCTKDLHALNQTFLHSALQCSGNISQVHVVAQLHQIVRKTFLLCEVVITTRVESEFGVKFARMRWKITTSVFAVNSGSIYDKNS